MPKTTFTIKGMHCDACTGPLGQELKKVVGVKQALVNYGTEQAVVDHDGRASFQDFQTVVQHLGYHAFSHDAQDNYHDIRLIETRKLHRLRLRLVIAVLFTLALLLLSFPELFTFVPTFLISSYILLLLTLPIQFYAALDFYKGLWYSLQRKTVDKNTFVALGISILFLYSLLATFFPLVFFSSVSAYSLSYVIVSLIITLVLFGKYLEAVVQRHTSDSLRALLKLQPPLATVLRHGKQLEVPLTEVVVGDILLVKAGQPLPVDGLVMQGSSLVDASKVIGTSSLVEKSKGMQVVGGSINKEHTFNIQATAVGKDTLLSRMISSVREAQSHKTPLQLFADNFVRILMPLLLMLSIVTFLVWLLFGPSPAFFFACFSFVTLLLLAGSSALSLATPTAVMVATGKAAQHGILLKGGNTIEALRQIDTVIFDKSGTLTQGKPTVTDIIAFQGDEKTVLKFAALAEKRSKHTLAQAILTYAQQHDIAIPDSHSSQMHAGKGIVAKYLGKKVAVGNRQLMHEQSIDITPLEARLQSMESAGKTLLIVGVNTVAVGVLGFVDAPNAYARSVVQALQRLGKQVVLITGDHTGTAQATATDLQITQVIANVLPQDRAAHIRTLQAQGRVVALVGDGITDAAALKQADVGIVLGTGMDLMTETGQVLLIKNDLRDVVIAIDLSMQTVKKIKQNISGALLYTVVGVPVAAGILYPFTGFLLQPLIAAGAMALSSLLVVLNSLSIKRYKPRI